ncbi:MAG: phage major capsid protein [Nitrospiraceae bacterium]
MPKKMTREELSALIANAANAAVEGALKNAEERRKAAGFDPSQLIERAERTGNEKAGDVGLTFGRALLCMAAGGMNRGDALGVWKNRFQGDKSVEKALSASDFTAGGALLQTEFAREVIEFLRPASVVMASLPRVISMGMGSIEIPKINTGAVASYVGENQFGGITEPSFGNLVLVRKKLKAEVPVSNDVLRFAAVNADQIIRDDAVAAMAQRQDAAFIRDDGTSFTPKGLRFQVPSVNVIASAGTNTLVDIESELGRAELALRDKDVRFVRPGWLLSPRTERRLKTIRTGVNENYAFRDEMNAGRLNGFPYKVTTQIPEDLGAGTETEVYLTDFAEVIVGEAQELLVEASSVAAYNDGATLRSAFSRDQTVIKVMMQHDIGLRHDFAISVISGVLWTP